MPDTPAEPFKRPVCLLPSRYRLKVDNDVLEDDDDDDATAEDRTDLTSISCPVVQKSLDIY